MLRGICSSFFFYPLPFFLLGPMELGISLKKEDLSQVISDQKICARWTVLGFSEICSLVSVDS